MAGDWLKVEKVTPDKPEIDAMAAALSMDPDAVFGKCFRLWRWFDDHTVDGNAPSVTRALVDRRVGVTGFAAAMESVGWLIVGADGVALPKFERHNGQTGKQRALTAKRVAEHKSKSNATTNGKGNASLTVGALPREEKRIEEIGGSTPLTPPVSSSFENWWSVVHSKTGRVKAEKEYKNAVKRLAIKHADPHAYLLDRMKVFAASPSAKPPDRTPIHPATWLSQGRYDDDPETWQLTGNAKGKPDERRTAIGSGQRFDSAAATRPPGAF